MTRRARSLFVWNAGIGLYAAAQSEESPGEILCSVLGIAPEIVHGGSTDIVAKHEDTVPAQTCLGIEGIEDCTNRWYFTTRRVCWTTGSGTGLGYENSGLKVERRLGMVIVVLATR